MAGLVRRTARRLPLPRRAPARRGHGRRARRSMITFRSLPLSAPPTSPNNRDESRQPVEECQEFFFRGHSLCSYAEGLAGLLKGGMVEKWRESGLRSKRDYADT